MGAGAGNQGGETDRGQAIAISAQTRPEPGIGEGPRQLLFDLGVEPSMTVNEAAVTLRWSYSKARRYFGRVEGSRVPAQAVQSALSKIQDSAECVRQRMGGDNGREPEWTEIIGQQWSVLVTREFFDRG